MALSYITATTTAVATAVGMNMLTKVLSGAAGGMVAARGQQSPRENIPQAWRCCPCLSESGMARAQPARGQCSRGIPRLVFLGSLRESGFLDQASGSM